MLGCVIRKYRKGRKAGHYRETSALSCAIILMMLVTGAIAEPVAVKSDDAYAASAPILSEPSTMRVPLGAGAATATLSDSRRASGVEGRSESVARNINLDFHGADIADVLKALSTQSRTNIVTSPDVKGQITVTLNRVSFGEAMDTLTRLAGLKYAMTNEDTYVVGPAAAVDSVQGITSEPTVTETMTLAYASLEQFSKTLDAQAPGVKYAQAGAGDKPGPRLLLLSGPKSQVEMAQALVENVERTLADDAAGRVVEVYSLNYAGAKDVVAALVTVLPNLNVSVGPAKGVIQRPPQYITFVSTSSGGGGGSGGGGAPEPPEEPTTVVLSGSVADVAQAKTIIAALDIKPKQVIIEARVTDITLGAEKRLGITWSWTNIAFSEGTKSSGAGNGHFARLPFDIEGQLDAMMEDNSARMLANPTIAALEGKSATIFIGDEVKYIIRIEQTPTGTNFQTETASVGITLRVIARPDSDGYITLALHPEVSTITDWLSIGTGVSGSISTSAVALPQIARRYTDHVIRVKDGETIVIGGLIKDNEIENMSKIPLLGDLPFLGGLFRHREKTKTHSDIAIFIKASVLADS